MKGKEPSVQGLTLFFQYAHSHLNTGIPQFPDAPTLHLGKLINTAYYRTLHTFLDNQVGTRGCLPIMRTGFQRHIDRCLRQQSFVLCADTCKSIDLCMPLSTAHMITFANDSTISHYHSSHHWIRLCILLSVLRQLQTAAHIFFIQRNLVGFHILCNFAV